MDNKKPRKITKAVIAAAGYGTRFLPATKNQPKEMLPIIDKPIIHYLVEECVNSGITDIIIVCRFGQQIMEDYFDNHSELEHYLLSNGKKESLEKIIHIPEMANFIYVRQKKSLPYGNGSPLLAVKNLIDDDEAFAFLFGDDLVKSKTPAIKQLMKVYEEHHPAAVLAVQEEPWEEVKRYGAIRYKKDTKINQIEEIVEKPDVEEAKKRLSNKVQFGRFIFSYKVIKAIEKIPLGKGKELWITDALNYLAQRNVVIAQPIEGKWLTTGDPLRYLKATVEYALERDDLKEKFENFLKGKIT
ncbi:MAG: sugar phosphate nucleotidyltransferase [bacterium]